MKIDALFKIHLQQFIKRMEASKLAILIDMMYQTMILVAN
jgi:hypothetical protein